MKKKLKILVVDDHPVFREGLSGMLESISFIEKVYKADSIWDAIKSIQCFNIDVLFTDLEMPNGSGFQLLEKLNDLQLGREPKRIIVSIREDKPTLLACLELGIDGYIPKSTSKKEVLRIFERLDENETYFSKNVSPYLYGKNSNVMLKKEREKIVGLTKIEMKVLILSCYQMTLLEMADFLNLAEGTIKKHRFNLYKKIDCKNMVGLAYFAWTEGYLKPHEVKENNPKQIFDRLFK